MIQHLPLPKTTKGIVLKELLTRRAISEQEIRFNGFRARISELRKKDLVNITDQWLPFVNRVGKKSHCKTYSIPVDDFDFAIQVYKKLLKVT